MVFEHFCKHTENCISELFQGSSLTLEQFGKAFSTFVFKKYRAVHFGYFTKDSQAQNAKYLQKKAKVMNENLVTCNFWSYLLTKKKELYNVSLSWLRREHGLVLIRKTVIELNDLKVWKWLKREQRWFWWTHLIF